MEIQKRSTVRSKVVNYTVKGKLEVDFGQFNLSIEEGSFIHLLFNPCLTTMGHIYPASPDKSVWRAESVTVLRCAIDRIKKFDKERAISELEEAITRINELI